MKGIRDITTSQRVCKMTSDDYVKFTLKRSGVSDAGTYCILARNAYGCDRAFVTVVVSNVLILTCLHCIVQKQEPHIVIC